MPSPDMFVHILISLPCEPVERDAQRRSSTEDEFDELPEIVVGSAQVVPVVSDSSRPNLTGSLSTDSMAKEKCEIGELEYVEHSDASGVVTNPEQTARRIRWEKMELGKWRIEGMT